MCVCVRLWNVTTCLLIAILIFVSCLQINEICAKYPEKKCVYVMSGTVFLLAHLKCIVSESGNKYKAASFKM